MRSRFNQSMHACPNSHLPQTSHHHSRDHRPRSRPTHCPPPPPPPARVPQGNPSRSVKTAQLSTQENPVGMDGRTYVTGRFALVARLLGDLGAVHIFGDRVRRCQAVTTRKETRRKLAICGMRHRSSRSPHTAPYGSVRHSDNT